MKKEKKINLICRIVGNIYPEFIGETGAVERAVEKAFEIFNDVERRVEIERVE